MFPLTELFFFVAIFLFSLSFLSGFLTKKKKSSENCPPSIPAIPVLGSLPFIAWNAAGHIPRYFLKKSEELGPIFTFKIGSKDCLVLNNFEVIEEAFVKKSSVFSGRQIAQQDVFSGNKNLKGIVGGNFNAYWKHHQKLSLSILRELGFGNSNVTESRISHEVQELVETIKSKNGRPFDPKDLMLHISANVIHQMMFADRTSFNDEMHRLYSLGNEYMENMLPIIDVAPWLRFFPYFRQIVQYTSKIHSEILQILNHLVNDAKSGDRGDSFVKRYIEKETVDCEMEQLLFVVRDLSLGGMDTTGSTVLWSLLHLANNPPIQAKLQKEIDEIVPRSRLPSHEDKKNLPYMEAFIWEVLRIKALLPMAFSHSALSDTHLSGFFVPEGTMVMANLYGANMDPKFWKDPESFRPERFLDEHLNIINKERCISFSLGRRSCLGEVLARQELFQIISGLVQNFVVLPPEGQKIINSEGIAQIFYKPTKFQVRMIYRSGPISSCSTDNGNSF